MLCICVWYLYSQRCECIYLCLDTGNDFLTQKFPLLHYSSWFWRKIFRRLSYHLLPHILSVSVPSIFFLIKLIFLALLTCIAKRMISACSNLIDAVRRCICKQSPQFLTKLFTEVLKDTVSVSLNEKKETILIAVFWCSSHLCHWTGE